MDAHTHVKWETRFIAKISIPAVALTLAIFIFCTTARAAEQTQPATLSHPNSAESAKLDESSCTDGFSFVVMSDSHTGHPEFDDMLAAATAMRPDFAISAGDVTDNGKDDEYRAYLDRINATGIPWFTAPGNHEYRSPDGHTSTDGRARFKRIFGKSDFSFTHCGWKFIIVDIVAYDSLMPGQLKWIEKELEGFEGRAAVVMHYPPAVLEKWKEGYWVANGADFLKLLEKDRVPYFFSGHIHAHDRLTLGPTTFIVAGGAGGAPDTDRPLDSYYSPGGGAYRHFMFIVVPPSGKPLDFTVIPPR